MKQVKETVTNFLNDLRKIMKENGIDSISFVNSGEHHTIELDFKTKKESIILGEYDGDGGLIDDFELASLLNSGLTRTEIATFDPKQAPIKSKRFTN